jgi:hypothetical protein
LRDDNYSCLRVRCLDLSRCLEAVDRFHLDVHQNNVRFILPIALNCFGAIFTFNELVNLFLDELLDHSSDVFAVIDNENFHVGYTFRNSPPSALPEAQRFPSRSALAGLSARHP